MKPSIASCICSPEKIVTIRSLSCAVASHAAMARECNETSNVNTSLSVNTSRWEHPFKRVQDVSHESVDKQAEVAAEKLNVLPTYWMLFGYSDGFMPHEYDIYYFFSMQWKTAYHKFPFDMVLMLSAKELSTRIASHKVERYAVYLMHRIPVLEHVLDQSRDQLEMLLEDNHNMLSRIQQNRRRGYLLEIIYNRDIQILSKLEEVANIWLGNDMILGVDPDARFEVWDPYYLPKGFFQSNPLPTNPQRQKKSRRFNS